MKVLVIHASAGAGHLKAAEAIYEQIQKDTNHQAVLVDALDYTSPFFKKMYRGSYFFMISKCPPLWGFFFALVDLDFLQPLIRAGRRIYNGLNGRKLHRYLCDQQFDYIFSTHFMSTEVSAALKRSGRIRSKIVTVVTDFDVHKIWRAKGVDQYAVASDWTKEKVKTLGVPEKNIVVTGIPTNEKFSGQPDVATLKTKLEIRHDVFTVLLATGSFGIGPIEEIIAKLKGFQVVVICGHNKSLFQRLSREKLDLVKVCGLVDNMHEWMAVSDAMVTKPGGLSISEALVSQLPMIFFNAIPGQETNNIKVLKEHGIGVNSRCIEDIVRAVTTLKSSRDAFMTALKKTKALARPSAVKDIVGLIK